MSCILSLIFIPPPHTQEAVLRAFRPPPADSADSGRGGGGGLWGGGGEGRGEIKRARRVTTERSDEQSER